MIKIRGPKRKKYRLLLQEAAGALATHRYPPHSGVAGAHGTNARGRGERARKVSEIFGFGESERQRDRARGGGEEDEEK